MILEHAEMISAMENFDFSYAKARPARLPSNKLSINLDNRKSKT